MCGVCSVHDVIVAPVLWSGARVAKEPDSNDLTFAIACDSRSREPPVPRADRTSYPAPPGRARRPPGPVYRSGPSTLDEYT